MCQLTDRVKLEILITTEIIKRDGHFDDIYTVADTITKILKVRNEIIEEISDRACFFLIKWMSNESSITEELPNEIATVYLLSKAEEN